MVISSSFVLISQRKSPWFECKSRLFLYYKHALGRKSLPIEWRKVEKHANRFAFSEEKKKNSSKMQKRLNIRQTSNRLREWWEWWCVSQGRDIYRRLPLGSNTHKKKTHKHSLQNVCPNHFSRTIIGKLNPVRYSEAKPRHHRTVYSHAFALIRKTNQ